jgi:hypothetical protein
MSQPIFSMDDPPPREATSVALESSFIQPTFVHALRIWWAFYWPQCLAALALFVGWMAGLASLSRHAVITSSIVLLLLVIAGELICVGLTSYFAMYYVLNRQFRNFRVAFVDADDFDHPQVVPRTFQRVVRVWWPYSWRALIYCMILRVVAALPIGFFVALINRTPIIGQIASFLFEAAIIGGVGLYLFYDLILDDRFGDARVCLLPRVSTRAMTTQANAAAPAPIA